jgi:hypothetical protein
LNVCDTDTCALTGDSKGAHPTMALKNPTATNILKFFIIIPV